MQVISVSSRPRSDVEVFVCEPSPESAAKSFAEMFGWVPDVVYRLVKRGRVTIYIPKERSNVKGNSPVR